MSTRVMLAIAAVLVVAGAVLLGRASFFAEAGEELAFGTMAPAQQGVGGLFRPLAAYIEALQQARDLKADRDELNRQAELLTTEVLRLREVEIENARLRQMLRFTQGSSLGTLVAAQVIGADPSNFIRSITVNRGTNDGIVGGHVVLAAAGLVGRVTDVSGSVAKVITLTDPSTSVSGIVQREDSRATGVISAGANGQLQMKFIQQTESIKVDDVIVTSGLGGNFPKGLVIGKVTRVTQNDAQLFQEALIEPAVRFAKLEDVAVMLDFTPSPQR